jgi:PKD repeat protein
LLLFIFFGILRKRGSEMKKLFLIMFLTILAAGLASASFNVRNTSIESKYSPGETIRGWINMSLDEEDTDSLLAGFEDEIEILDFLRNNSLAVGTGFSCSPSDCNTSYSGKNSGESKSFSLAAGDKKLIGVKITGAIESISRFSMNLQSDAGESGSPQLFFDFLDDDEIEWQATNFSGNFGQEIYGCYESDDASKTAEITQTEYCQKIRVPPVPKMKLGADVAEVAGKGGNVDFQMRIYNDDENEFCTASASASGRISCEVDLVNSKFEDFYVCIKTEDYEDNNKYSIKYEQEDACGFSSSNEEEGYDFAIFVMPGKYLGLGNFVLNQDTVEDYNGLDLAGYFEDYIDRYNNNCSRGCFIPIKIISGVNQNLVISNMELSYTAGVSTTERGIYDLSESPAKISMDYRVLDLGKSDIKVPSSYGNKTLTLKLDGDGIVSKNIEVIKIDGAIAQILPLGTSASVPTRFTVYASGSILKYRWEFGDGENVTTTQNYTSHTFSKSGKYSLKVTIITPTGNSSKTVEIIVGSPYGEINKTLAERERELSNLTYSLNGINGWYKGELEKEININGMKSELQNISQRYKNSTTESEYTEILTALYALQIPSKVEQTTFKGVFLPSEIDPSYLTEFGYNTNNPSEYSDRITSWMVGNLNINLDNTIFYLKYSDRRDPLLTTIKASIEPVNPINQAYLIIEKQGIIFKENYSQTESGGATGIKLSNLQKEKIIEFVIPEEIEAISLPLYISPPFSELPGGIDIVCDNDGKCESGETEENCINDCHKWPWGKIIMWVLIILFCLFVIYIILQEWYKRRYESYLFKNKNDLYNLMSFMDNALRRGMGKDEVYDTLKKYKWNSEQITYAFKKLSGRRTGMWEIPIFRVFENKKIQQELAARRNTNNPYLQKI